MARFDDFGLFFGLTLDIFYIERVPPAIVFRVFFGVFAHELDPDAGARRKAVGKKGIRLRLDGDFPNHGPFRIRFCPAFNCGPRDLIGIDEALFAIILAIAHRHQLPAVPEPVRFLGIDAIELRRIA